jgi:hypothetical protein
MAGGENLIPNGSRLFGTLLLWQLAIAHAHEVHSQMRNKDQKAVCSRGYGGVFLALQTFKPGIPSCCSFFCALADVCAMHLRRPLKPNNAIAATLKGTHSKVRCAAECLMPPACDGLPKAWATLSALVLPPPPLPPLVLPLPPQTSQKLTSRNPPHKCSSLSKAFYCRPFPLTISPASQSRHPTHLRLLSCFSTDVESG